jgi:HD-GYP domain-containing protein (c-di-GMP phosphodiesterase class II)
MKRRRLTIFDLTLGAPLPWDVFDGERELLLRKGYVVENAHQLESLVQRGLYIDAHHVVTRQPADGTSGEKEVPSVVRMLDSANKNLERVLTKLGDEPEVPTRVMEIAETISTAVEMNPDIAVAYVILNQATGSYPIHHGVYTAIIACRIARAMRKEAGEIRNIMAAALTMNVGMLPLHAHLHGKAAPLTEAERKFIHEHPERSAALLAQAGVENAEWLSYVLLHQEDEDGSGYPLGPITKPLPQNMKILALADRYCACIADRGYRKPLTPPTALREIFASGGSAVDPLLAAYFIKELGTYPPGTFVRLENREIAVVTGRGATPAQPLVHALIAAGGDPLSAPIRRDTAVAPFGILEPLQYGEAQLRFSMRQFWGDEAAL